jgi:two-component system CheB/CheR fusion protein
MGPHEGGQEFPGIVRDALSRIGTLLDTLFETAGDAIFLMDGLRFVDCNPATITMFGVQQKEQILGETPLRFSPPIQPDGETSAEKAGRVVMAALDGASLTFEWTHQKLDGTPFEVEVRLNRCVVGGRPFLVSVVRDITARKQALRALQRQVDADELINRILARCAVWTPSQFDSIMSFALAELNDFLGADHAFFIVPSIDWSTYGCTHEIAGPHVTARLSRIKEVPTGSNGWMESTLLAGKTINLSSVVDHPARARWLALDPGSRSLLVVPTKDTSGKFAGAIGLDSHTLVKDWSASDVMLASIIGNTLTAMTERKRAADQLIEEKQLSEHLMGEAQAASSAKDQFLAVLSHELRNPLAAIQAGVDSLRHAPSDDDARRNRALEIIERNVTLQARLVDDLLDLSRLARGKLTLRRGPVLVSDVIASAVHGSRVDAARVGIALEEHIEPDLWVNADPDRLEQVVLNLVGNGIKFTPNGGRVVITAHSHDGKAWLVVEDTGVGIEKERLSDLFQMFRQGQLEARRAPGLGVGLALVRAIVELHGGSVWAESAGTGRGSRFTVELPLVAPAHTHVPRAPEVQPSGKRKMLLIEDNADTRELLAETFTQLAYDVRAADSGERALEVLEHESVDVIVADIGLPGIDGYEFLRRARAMPSAAHTAAFALTGYGQEADVRRSREAGYNGHFVKPVDAGTIDARIRAR